MWSSVLFLSLALVTCVKGTCNSYEKEYYEELGCKPEEAEGSKCPVSYDCSLLRQRSKSQCHYQGQVFDQGQKIHTSAAPCLVECRCIPAGEAPDSAMISCISVECPEWFNGPPRKGCHRTYKHDTCCHVGLVCDDTIGPKSPKITCQYSDRLYKEGEKFYPDEEPCLKCICQEGFNGSLVEPYCQKASCNLELTYSDNIAGGCVPVFYGEKSCCPIDWRCPEATDSVLPSTEKRDTKTTSDAEKTCKFGNLTMHIGERLNKAGDERECTCRVPPQPICIQQENE